MSAEDTFGSPAIEKIAGEDIEFPILLMAEYGKVEAAAKSARTSVITAILDDCKIAGAERFAAMRESLARPVSILDVDEYLGTHAGAKFALEASLKKGGKPDEEAKATVAKIVFPNAVTLARVVVGILVRQPPAKEADPLPQTPAPTPSE